MNTNVETSISELSHSQSDDSDRIHYMDYIRAFIIALVVVEHSAIPYMVTESKSFWFFYDENTSLAFTGFVILANVIIRPTLFFVSGFFFFPSLLKKGPLQLMQAKLIRLGIPLVLGTLFINPVAFYIANLIKSNDVGSFIQYWFSNWLIGKDTAVAHLWFLQSLLVVTSIYCYVYTVKPSLLKRLAAIMSEKLNPVSQLALFGGLLTLVLFVATLAIGGNVYKVWSWLGNGVIYLEPVRFINYLFYFGLGIVLRQNVKQFSSFFPNSKDIGLWLLLTGFSSTALVLFAVMFKLTLLDSYELILIASLLRVSTSLFALVLLILVFEKYLTFNSFLSNWISGNSYAVYIIHLPIVVGLQALLLSVTWSAYTKFIVVAILSLTLSYLLGSAFLRRLPVMNRLL